MVFQKFFVKSVQLRFFVGFNAMIVKRKERSDMPKRKQPMTQINVAFPDPLREKIRELARQRDEGESVIVRELVRKSLEVA